MRRPPPSAARRALAIAMLASLAIAGCKTKSDGASDSPASGPTVVRVQLNWVPEPEFGGLYAAVEHGFYAKAGLGVELIKGSAGVPSAQLAANGKVEFAVVSGPEIVKLRPRGADLVALYAQFRLSPRGIVVHEANPHTSLETLWKSASTVVLEPGLTFGKWLDRRFGGASLKKVPSTGNLAGFMADTGLAQAVYVFAEPVELKRRAVPVRILDVAETGFNPYEAVLVTRRAYLESNRATVDAFIDATRQGWQAYLEAPGSTNAAMAKLNPAMSKAAMDTATDIAARYIRGVDPGPLGSMSTARWAALVDQLVQLGELEPDEAPKPASLYLAR